jgi:hypothetical protein
MKISKKMKEIDAPWFSIRLVVAMLDQYRFFKQYKNKQLVTVKIKDVKDTKNKLKLVAQKINELAEKI